MDDALALFTAVQTYLTTNTSDGDQILYEKACTPDPLCSWTDPPLPSACKCDNNQMIFKGIVSRYLMYLRDDIAKQAQGLALALGLEDAEEERGDEGKGKVFQEVQHLTAAASSIDAFLKSNADAAWANARVESTNDFGIFWQGPVFGAVPANSGNTNQAVLDVLVATLN